MGHSQFPRASLSGQSPRSRRWHPNCHRCLLKGCEDWFLPRRPQARYCSPACQKAARRWRRWLSCQRFKATTHGKKLRREQVRRYRIRLQQRSSLAEPAPPACDVELTSPVVESQTSTAPSESPPVASTPAEDQRPAKIPEQSCGLTCHRPGCYILFLPSGRSPDQKFCSNPCRQALRRVRQRELRLRQLTFRTSAPDYPGISLGIKPFRRRDYREEPVDGRHLQPVCGRIVRRFSHRNGC